MQPRKFRNEDYEAGAKPSKTPIRTGVQTPRARFRQSDFAEQREDYRDDPNQR